MTLVQLTLALRSLDGSAARVCDAAVRHSSMMKADSKRAQFSFICFPPDLSFANRRSRSRVYRHQTVSLRPCRSWRIKIDKTPFWTSTGICDSPKRYTSRPEPQMRLLTSNAGTESVGYPRIATRYSNRSQAGLGRGVRHPTSKTASTLTTKHLK